MVIMLVAGQFGCGARRAPLQPPEIAPKKLDTIQDVTQSLYGHYGSINSLKASGKIQFKLVDEEHWRPADFLLMLERPDKLRMRAYRPLVSSLFELVSNGEECWLYFPSDRTAYLSDCGPADAYANPAVSADVVVSAITVVSDFDRLPSLPMSLAHGDSLLRLSLDEGDFVRDLWLDETTGLIARQQVLNEDGVLVADIVYLEHAAIDGAAVPVRIEIELQRMRSLIRLVVEEARLDPEIPADAFNLVVPEDVRILVPDSRKWGSNIPLDSGN
ncbi:MAG: hypothetical protein Kow0099_18690 [Candidatus Abyssubacteria bacterium]